MSYRLTTLALAAVLAVGSAVMFVVGALVRTMARGRRRSPSERGQKFGAELVEALRSGIAEGPQHDTLHRIDDLIERGVIRPSPFWIDFDD